MAIKYICDICGGDCEDSSNQFSEKMNDYGGYIELKYNGPSNINICRNCLIDVISTFRKKTVIK